jgi:opacity protein-like surface antigen
MNSKFLGATIALLALAGQSAFAQSSTSSDGTAYVGIAGGMSHFAGACESGIHCEKNKAAVKVYGGYTLFNDLSAEVTYYDLGTTRASFADGTNHVAATLHGAYWGLGGAWRPELGNGWGGVVRVGAAYSEGKIGASDGSLSFSEKRSSWQPYAGLGATYKLTKDIKLEADYDFTRVGSQVTDPTTQVRDRTSTSVSNFMVGASFQF